MSRKAKNGYSNYEPTSSGSNYHMPDRSGCLSLYLGFQILASVGLMGYALLLISEFGFGPAGLLLLSFVLAAVNLFVMVGVWNWKRWAYNGALFLLGMNALVNLVIIDVAQLVGSVIALIIFYKLMEDYVPYLE